MTLCSPWRADGSSQVGAAGEGDPWVLRESDWRAACTAMTHLFELELELLGSVVISTVSRRVQGTGPTHVACLLHMQSRQASSKPVVKGCL